MYFTHYSCVVIISFITGLWRSAYSAYSTYSTISFWKVVFCLSVLSVFFVLNQIFSIKTLKYVLSCHVILLLKHVLSFYLILLCNFVMWFCYKYQICVIMPCNFAIKICVIILSNFCYVILLYNFVINIKLFITVLLCKTLFHFGFFKKKSVGQSENKSVKSVIIK